MTEPAELCAYGRALELADGEGVFVSKFTLEDLHRAQASCKGLCCHNPPTATLSAHTRDFYCSQDAEDRLVPNDRSELLQWLGAAFGEGKPVGVHGVGAKRTRASLQSGLG